jgi:hypothetical protein
MWTKFISLLKFRALVSGLISSAYVNGWKFLEQYR